MRHDKPVKSRNPVKHFHSLFRILPVTFIKLLHLKTRNVGKRLENNCPLSGGGRWQNRAYTVCNTFLKFLLLKECSNLLRLHFIELDTLVISWNFSHLKIPFPTAVEMESTAKWDTSALLFVKKIM